MNQVSRITILTLMTIAMVSCGKLGLYNQDKGEVIATADGKKLYISEVQGLLGSEMSPEDSTKFVEAYINSWIKNELKVAAAQTMLSSQEQAIDQLVEQYRRSLLTYRYEERIVSQKLDTTITEKQVEEYYTENRDNFRLPGPLVKAAVARLPIQLRLGAKFENLFKNSNDSTRREFQTICQKNNYKYEDFSNEWTDFSTVITHIPFEGKNYDEFLKSKKYYEVQDRDYKYMMNIISYRPTGDYSPIELQKNNIRKILLNTRRAEIIRELDDSLMNKALTDKTVQINKPK